MVNTPAVPDLSSAPLDVQLEIIQGLEEEYGPSLTFSEEKFKPITLTDSQIETALPWYLMRVTEPGEWYLGTERVNSVFAEMSDDVGISKTKLKSAAEATEHEGLLEFDRQFLRGNDVTTNMRVTETGREVVDQLTVFEPRTFAVIEQAIVHYKKYVASEISSEVNQERIAIGESPQEFEFDRYNTVAAIGFEIARLRLEQHRALKEIGDVAAADEMRNLPELDLVAA